ncbi:MAG: alanine racemase [Burkholderiales bacterium]|jgi:alanine racemase|nr:alanine racemase [Burkholderiales bacterium]
MSRQTIAQINLSAFRHNLRCVRTQAPSAQVLAVVKANAYGHGLMNILPALNDADGLALLELPAGIALRERKYGRRILLLEGFFSPDELKEISRHRLAVVVHSHEQIEMLQQAKLARPLEIFLKINTGMNRLGIPVDKTKQYAELLTSFPSVAALRLMTHLGRGESHEGAVDQLAKFEEACQGLPYPKSIANSAGILRYNAVGGEIVRAGLMLYGSSPLPGKPAHTLGLQSVMTLRSELIAVQEVAAGELVGYGEVYRTTRRSRIGVVACGYADGYPVTARNGTPVIVAGKRTVLVGRVSMDMMCVDLTDIPEANPGSPVTLWGEGLPIDEIAHRAGVISYQLMCAVAPRVRFVTTEVGKVDFEL